VHYEWSEAKEPAESAKPQRHLIRTGDKTTFVFEDQRTVLLVVHAYREDCHGEEIIRIISARQAEKHEVRRYQEQKMD
jgi:uncharacterized DUF497 family protein